MRNVCVFVVFVNVGGVGAAAFGRVFAIVRQPPLSRGHAAAVLTLVQSQSSSRIRRRRIAAFFCRRVKDKVKKGNCKNVAGGKGWKWLISLPAVAHLRRERTRIAFFSAGRRQLPGTYRQCLTGGFQCHWCCNTAESSLH